MVKVVMITGAAKGLGRALAEEFLGSGWRVIATDIDDLSMAGLLGNERVWICKMDVTSDESVQQVVEDFTRKGIVIDLIINNAGIDAYFPLSETPVNRFRNVFEVNVFGGYRVNQSFLPLVRRPGGRIIHISSESLKLTVPFMPYPLSKQLVESYARALRIELKFLGIDVVIVRPGAISTRLLDGVRNLGPLPESSSLSKPFGIFAATASREIGKTITPQKAAAFIYRVSRIPHPSSLYRINNMFQLRIAAWLPFWLFEKLIYRRLL